MLIKRINWFLRHSTQLRSSKSEHWTRTNRMMTPIKLNIFFYSHLAVISPGSNNALMFTRLVLTNTDLLHLVTSTLVLEHSRNGKWDQDWYFSLFKIYFFRILPPKTMPGTRLTPASGKWSRQKATTGDTEPDNYTNSIEWMRANSVTSTWLQCEKWNELMIKVSVKSGRFFIFIYLVKKICKSWLCPDNP